jgi:hypothetical protein
MDDLPSYSFRDGDFFHVPPETFEPRELPPEVQDCYSIHYRVGIVNPPQESPFLHDPHSVSTYSAVSTARPLDAEPFFLNDDFLTVLLCEQHASLQSENFFILTLTLIAVGRDIREDNSGPPTFPTQVSGTSNHGPMTPQPQQGESSHSQLAF